jgi:hypothetical protein
MKIPSLSDLIPLRSIRAPGRAVANAIDLSTYCPSQERVKGEGIKKYT